MRRDAMLLDILPFVVIAAIAGALYVWLCCANELKAGRDRLHDFLKSLDQ